MLSLPFWIFSSNCRANNSKIIDIINKKDFRWYSCCPKNTVHKFVFKSNEKIKFQLKKFI